MHAHRHSSVRPSARRHIIPCRLRACSSANPNGSTELASRQVIALDPFEHPEQARQQHRVFRREARALLRRRAPDRRRERVRRRGDACQAPARRGQARARRLLEQWRARASCRPSCRAWRRRDQERHELRRGACTAGLGHGCCRAAARDGFRSAGTCRDRRAGHPRRSPGAQVTGQARQRRAHRSVEPLGRRPRGPCRPRHRPLRRPRDHRGGGRAA